MNANISMGVSQNPGTEIEYSFLIAHGDVLRARYLFI